MTLAPVGVREVDGHVAGTLVLDESVFGVQPNVPAMHQVVTGQLAAARSGTQSTKTRSEVSGGGSKPYRQKGTGRARQGSTRAPHYAGGGVALGPKPRSYRQRTPKKMTQLALRGALSDRAAEGRIVVVDQWGWEEPKTRTARAALETLGVEGRVLVVLKGDEDVARRSFRNLPGVDLTLAGQFTAYDVLRSDWVVFSRDTLPGENAWTPAAEAAAAEAATAEPEAEQAGEPVHRAARPRKAKPPTSSDPERAADAAAAAAAEPEPNAETEAEPANSSEPAPPEDAR